jgi:hypothetical protein
VDVVESLNLNGETLYNLSAAIGFIAYLMTNVLWLRLLLVVGAETYIYTGLLLDLDSMVFWHIAYGSINLVQVLIILSERSTTSLPEDIRDLYTGQFETLKPKEFKRIMATNNRQQLESGLLLQQGNPNERLYLILAGEVGIKINGKLVAICSRGDFIGEMSLLTNQSTSADAYILKEANFAYWELSDLQKLETRNISLYNRFMMVLSRNLVLKLNRHHTTYLLSEYSCQNILKASWHN